MGIDSVHPPQPAVPGQGPNNLPPVKLVPLPLIPMGPAPARSTDGRTHAPLPTTRGSSWAHAPVDRRVLHPAMAKGPLPAVNPPVPRSIPTLSPSLSSRPVAPGLWFSDTLRTRDGAPVRVLTVDPRRVRLGAAFTDGRRSVSIADLKKDPQFLAAVDGTFFGEWAIGDMRGLGRTYLDENVPRQGPAIDRISDRRWYVAVTQKGEVLTGRGGLAETGRSSEIDAFMGGMGVLFTRSQRDNLEHDIRSGALARRIIFRGSAQKQSISRSFLGVTGDGKIMLVTMGEGRFRSRGADFVEAARLLKSMGAAEAYILDGGGSTSMAVRGVVETRTDGRPLKGFLAVYGRTPQ